MTHLIFFSYSDFIKIIKEFPNDYVNLLIFYILRKNFVKLKIKLIIIKNKKFFLINVLVAKKMIIS